MFYNANLLLSIYFPPSWTTRELRGYVLPLYYCRLSWNVDICRRQVIYQYDTRLVMLHKVVQHQSILLIRIYCSHQTEW